MGKEQTDLKKTPNSWERLTTVYNSNSEGVEAGR